MKCICNFGYARTKRGGAHFPNVRGLLKYLQYRDNRNDHIPDAGGPDRWVDGGLGTSYQQISARLDELSPANPSAYCFAIVVSPDPEAMAETPKELRQDLFIEAVTASLAEWDDWRGEHDRHPQVGPIEYALVVHRPEREYGEQMHAHVILAAATEHSMTRDRTPLYNNRPEIEAFKETVYRQLDRVYELDRDQDRLQTPAELELDSPAEPQATPPTPAEIELDSPAEPGAWDREIAFHEPPAESEDESPADLQGDFNDP